MAEVTGTAQSVTISEDWRLHYDYDSGEILGRFLRGLQEQRVEGTRCPVCRIVWLPPRAYCERCFVKTDEWVTVGPEGTIEAATVVNQLVEGLPKPPYVIAYCRLDGADTALVNFVATLVDDVPAAAERVRPGTRVRVRFSDERHARITDFHYELL
jgi:uncharacterized OB-fold protein